MSRASPEGLVDDDDRVLRVSEWADHFYTDSARHQFTKQKSADSTAEKPVYEGVAM